MRERFEGEGDLEREVGIKEIRFGWLDKDKQLGMRKIQI